MAKKYCVEYGCLEPDKAIEYAKEIEKKKKPQSKNERRKKKKQKNAKKNSKG